MSGSCISNLRSRRLRAQLEPHAPGRSPRATVRTSAAGSASSRTRTDEDDEDTAEVEEERLGRSQREVGLLELVLDPVEQARRARRGGPVKPDHLLHEPRLGERLVRRARAARRARLDGRLLEPNPVRRFSRSLRWSPPISKTARARARDTAPAMRTAITIASHRLPRADDDRSRESSAHRRDRRPSDERLAGEQRRVERDAVVGEPLAEARADARALEVPEELAVLVDAHAVVEEVEVLEDDHVALHAHDLADVGDAPRAVAQAAEVDDEVERRGHLLADHAHRQVHAGHQRHRLDAGERVARRVRVDRRDRAVVTGVHRLEHVERLGATHLTDDDAVGPHAQRVAHEVADRDLALALDVRRAGLERQHVRLLELELLRVLDRDDALVGAG